MASALPWVVGGLGLLGTINQNHQQNAQLSAAQNAAAQASAGQNALDQQLAQIYQQQLGNFTQNFQPLENPLYQQFASLIGSQNMGNLNTDIMSVLTNPAMRDAFTGIPMQGITGNTLSYLSNPGATMSGAGGVGGQSIPFFLQEAQQGIDPAVVGSQLNNLQNANLRQINSMRNSLGSGMANPEGMMRDLGYQSMGSQADLLSGIAGQDQAFKNNAMSTAQQIAGGLDAQTMQMLLNAYNIGNQQTQQGVSGLQQAGQTGQNNIQDLLNYLGLGNASLGAASSGMTNLANQYGAAGMNAANNAANISANATNPFSSLANLGMGLWGSGLIK